MTEQNKSQTTPLPITVVGEAARHTPDQEVIDAGVQTHHELDIPSKEIPLIKGQVGIQPAGAAVPHHDQPDGSVILQEPEQIVSNATIRTRADDNGFNLGKIIRIFAPNDQSIRDEFNHRLTELSPREGIKHAA
jgi:hypothetical protein